MKYAFVLFVFAVFKENTVIHLFTTLKMRFDILTYFEVVQTIYGVKKNY